MSDKMIVMDLDGTLLRDDKTMSEYTKRVLCDCRNAGIKVVYATGRGGIATERVPSEMFDGRITMNGAITYADDELIRSCLIDIDLARDFLLACDRSGLKAVAETSGMHYSNFDVNAQWSFVSNYEITDFKKHNIDAEKLYVVLNNESDIEFIKKHIPNGLYLTISRDGIAFIMDDMATKSNAMTALAEHWSKSTIETIAFGDDLNDVDMLIMSGVGVAMGNALDEVKAVADEVCGCNNDDGVARWLEENMLIKTTLETERLILRSSTPDDFEAYHSWCSNPENTRYMSFGPNSGEETKAWLAQVRPGRDFAVVLKKSNVVIGSCGIYWEESGYMADVGWILHKDYHKHGYGTELCGELIRYGFEDLKLGRIQAPCAAVNYGSYRIMERNGMVREGLQRKAFWVRMDKEWIDKAWYAILAEDYFDESV